MVSASGRNLACLHSPVETNVLPMNATLRIEYPLQPSQPIAKDELMMSPSLAPSGNRPRRAARQYGVGAQATHEISRRSLQMGIWKHGGSAIRFLTHRDERR
eukprot:SAG11_NODE_1354_length_5128_cov_3.183337_3_plen_102_part_00